MNAFVEKNKFQLFKWGVGIIFAIGVLYASHKSNIEEDKRQQAAIEANQALIKANSEKIHKLDLVDANFKAVLESINTNISEIKIDLRALLKAEL